MKAKLIDLLTASIICARTDYEKAFDSAVADAEKKKAAANGSFIRERLKEELASIEEEKENRIKKAKAEAMERVAVYASEIRTQERKDVANSSFDLRSFQELQALGSLTVTGEEFTALCTRFEKYGYWSKRLLNDIAEKNGLPYSLGLSIDEKLGIVSEIVGAFGDYLEIYAGHGKTNLSEDRVARVVATVSDAVLTRAAKRYTAGDVLGTMSDERMALAMYNNIRGCDNFTGGMKLRNFLHNAPENAMNVLLLKLIADTEISGKIYKIAGVDADAIRKDYGERLEDYKQCGEKLEALKKSGEQLKAYKESKQDSYAAGVYAEMGKDMQRLLAEDTHGYLSGLIKSEARSNKELQEVAEAVGLVEHKAEETGEET